MNVEDSGLYEDALKGVAMARLSSCYHNEMLLTKNSRFEFYHAVATEDNRAVVLKKPLDRSPHSQIIACIVNEFEMGKTLDHNAILRYFDLVRDSSQIYLVTEYFDSKSLKDYLSDNQLTVDEVLRIGVQIADGLAEIHKHHLVHQLIKPSNILICPQTKNIKIADFSRATYDYLINNDASDKIESAEYISPEKTGRTNEMLDHRTDLYSLGVVLYEMLSSRLPFDVATTSELVHSHIAKLPKPPRDNDGAVPEMVSQIVMKLLAKSPLERYQSAQSLKLDLTRCLEQLNETGTIDTFPLARQDFTDNFRMARRLYGREADINVLSAAFDRVCLGTPEFVSISGPAGVGKTALVNAVYDRFVEKGAFFVSGKFDQYNRNVPYSAVIQALRLLFQQLMSLPEGPLNTWRERLSSGLEVNGHALLGLIPELEKLIEVKRELIAPGPDEQKNVFKLAFQTLIALFADVDHPLVIFLDDLQWSDLASFELLDDILSSHENRFLLVIGTFRGSESLSTDSTFFQLDKIRGAGAQVSEISLDGLALRDVNRLLSDILKSDSPDIEPLSELLLKKTAGNPFFVIQFLKMLYQLELLRFDSERYVWSWNTPEIIAQEITGNVVDLMILRFQQLPETQQRILHLAACIGNRFDLGTLGVISECPEAEILDNLNSATRLGFVQLVDNIRSHELGSQAESERTYEFMYIHDRVRQAAYELAGAEQRKSIHAIIGRLMLSQCSAEEIPETIFQIVNHLNLGRDVLTEDETKRLTALNLVAGKKAKNSIAYTEGGIFLETGIDLLPPNSWEQDYDLTFELYKESCECKCLETDFDGADSVFEEILRHVDDPIDLADVYCIAIRQHSIRAKYGEALDMGRTIVEKFGEHLPSAEQLDDETQTEIQRVTVNVGQRGVEDLLDLPMIDDVETKAMIRILTTLAPPMYFSNFTLFQYIIARLTNLGLTKGNASELPFAYGNMGLILCAHGEMRQGYEYGLLGLRLSEKLDSFRCVAHNTMGLCINHWAKHVKSSAEIARKGIQYGLEEGDIQFACYNCFGLVNALAAQSLSLGDLLQEVDRAILFVKNHKNAVSELCFLSVRQFALNLQGMTVDADTFDSEGYTEADFLKASEGLDMPMAYYHIFKLQSYYLFGRYDDALRMCDAARDEAQQVGTFFTIVSYNVFHSLTLTSLFLQWPDGDHDRYWKQLETNQNQLKGWADICPENYRHKYALVEAEIHRVRGENWPAVEWYRQAIEQAGEHGVTHMEAIANELCGRFWLETGNEEFATIHLRKAHASYSQWGALGKVNDLETTCAHLSLSTDKGITGDGVVGSDLDLGAITKAYQAISSEIDLKRLLLQIMTITIENSGAQRGCLILLQTDGMQIVATVDVNRPGTDDFQPASLETSGDIVAISIVNYVKHTNEPLALSTASSDRRFSADEYVRQTQPKSILCMPVAKSGKLMAILYLENNLSCDVFNAERLHLVELLSAQIAISIENARLFEERQASAEDLRITLNSIGDAVIATDEKGRVCRMNPVAEALTGWGTDNSLGLPLSEIYHVVNTKTGEPFTSLQEPTSESGDTTRTLHHGTLLSKDGTEYRINESSAPIRNAHGDMVGSVLVFRDVTEQYELENKLRQSEKLQAVGELAGGIAHDFNNMLAGIIGAAELLSLQLDSPHRKYLDIIFQSAGRATDLIRKLMSFSRKGDDLAELVDIHQLAAETVTLLERSIDKCISIELNLGAVHSCIMGDSAQLQSAILNLGLNARDAMPEGGVLSITSQNKTLDQNYCHTHSMVDLPPGEYIQISVGDTGAGIPPEFMDRIFEPFFTTKEQGKGTGLGLSTVYGTIQKSRGDIDLESELGKGTVFHLYLPVEKGQCDVKRPVGDATEFTYNGTILLIEDEAFVREPFTRMLEALGCTVLTAEDGEEGVALYQTRQDEIDLVFVDMVMPKLNGMDSFRAIRTINPDAKVILCSGFTQGANVSALLDEGLIGYLKKPFRKHELVEALTESLNHHP
ncbi:hypothetical protein BVX99_03360 [bacterium F16]|nr:hypothetical protein BVX99_03360 [bacterium F16]